MEYRKALFLREFLMKDSLHKKNQTKDELENDPAEKGKDLEEEKEASEKEADFKDKDYQGPKINFDYIPPEEFKEEDQNKEKDKEIEENLGQRNETLDDLVEKTKDDYLEVNNDPKPVSETVAEEEEDFTIRHISHQKNGSVPINTEPNLYPETTEGARNRFFPYDTSPAKKRNFKKYIFGLLLVALVVVTGSVYYLKFQPSDENSQINETSSNTSQVSSTPSSTSAVLVDRSKITVQILNGTSRKGLAASVSAKLKDLGYKTIDPDNATNSAFQSTVVRVKKNGNTAILEQLIKDLLPDFNATGSVDLDSTDIDAEIILGLK